jgi:chromosome segregation ATPase
MIKNILALLGTCIVIVGLLTWNYGYLSRKIDEVSTQIERETAVAKAEARIRAVEEKAGQIKEKARQLRIEARSREMALERDDQKRAKDAEAIQALVAAAKDAGLPKPSEAKADSLEKTLVFAGKTLRGHEAYALLQRWQGGLERDEQSTRTRRVTIDRLRKAAEQLDAQRERLIVQVAEVRGKLDELAVQRDMAKVERELAELGANSRGNFAGDLGKDLDTIQKEIDESLATVEVLGTESASAEVADPDALLKAGITGVGANKKLDSFWK